MNDQLFKKVSIGHKAVCQKMWDDLGIFTIMINIAEYGNTEVLTQQSLSCPDVPKEIVIEMIKEVIKSLKNEAFEKD